MVLYSHKYKFKNIIISILSLFILTINFHLSFGQIFDNEQSHSSIKWREINSENFRLLFPKDFENAARVLAKELDSFIKNSSADLGILPRKITLILQGNHLSQNGYVQLAPRKSEMYPVPSSTAGNTEWLSNLAQHELRHVAQFDKLTGRLKGPFLEQLALALFGLNLPAWYFEGDAVQIETLFSYGGRGRLPSWEMPIRTNVLSSKNYGFNKYVLGSFKDIVPSYYTIGYFMNTYLTNTHGFQSHEKIMEDMRGKLIRPYNFQRALKKVSNLNSKQLFKATLEDLHTKWEREKSANDWNPTFVYTKESPYPSNYLLPQTGLGNKIYALKSSPQQINGIVTIDSSGKEKTIIKTGIQITPYFHLRGDKIVWDEYRKHARFGKETYNVINMYDLSLGKLTTLTKNSRFYSPALHPTLDHIALVEVDKSNKSRLLIIDANDGHLLDSISVPENMHVQQPKYNETGDKIIAIAVQQQGISLIEFNLADKTSSVRLPWSHQQLERPSYHNGHIIFKAHYDGLDNIYRLGDNGNIHKLTNASYGAFNPTVAEDGELIYNDYQYNGYKIAKTPLHPVSENALDTHIFYLEKTLKQLPLDSVQHSEQDYVAKKYHPAAHMVNFHSLSISGTNFESFDSYIPGIFWLSNDLLNTTQIKLGYEFDTEISKSRYSAEISYRRYFPIFTARYMNRGLVGNAVSNTNKDSTVMYNYRDHLATFEMSLPFSVYRQNTVYSYGFNFGTSYTKRYDMDVNLKNFNDVIAFPLNYQLYFNKNAMRAEMDLLPKWGQNFSITYRHLPFEKELSGYIVSARTNFYFPGLVSNHSFQLRFAFQKSEDRYRNSYDIPLVSGWGHFLSPIVKNTAMANYRMPLFYPDWSIGSLAYIKRFQGMLFSDFQNMHHDIAPKSFGLGISADFNVFRYVQPDINISVKLTYINDKTASQRLIPTFGWSYSY